jgi:hypothetical protein
MYVLFYLDHPIFRHICKQQITDVILIINENNCKISWKSYTRNVYAFSLTFFANLKHLTIVPSSINKYPRFSLYDLPPTTFFSSILTKLCVNVDDFDDCLALLDGRLKQLITFTIQIIPISDLISTSYNMVSLCFALLSFSKQCIVPMTK